MQFILSILKEIQSHWSYTQVMFAIKKFQGRVQLLDEVDDVNVDNFM